MIILAAIIVILRYFVNFTMDKELKLTAEQSKVLKSDVPIKRVIACAGSGKTWVITKNIIEIINQGLCHPSQILALTFTRNAAENMRSRIRDHTSGNDFEDINIYTFNSFGYEIIKENSFQFSLGKDIKVLSSAESWQLIYKLFREHEFEHINLKKSPGKVVQDIISYIDSLKNNLITAQNLEHYIQHHYQYLQNYSSSALFREEKEAVKVQRELASIYRLYEEMKKESNSIDYQDQVYLPYFLLTEKDDIRESYRNRYSYIFVDEFQDTNIAQAYFLALLKSPTNKMVVVGDDDQGIYSFRGACVENILNFDHWEQFRQHRVKDFYLTTNFRSGSNIISALNQVISANQNRFEKFLSPAEGAESSEVLFFHKPNHQQEAAGMAELISQLNHRGVRLKDMAILNRRKQFDTIIRGLENKGIKYEIIGSKSFYFEPEILFLLSWLYLAYDQFDEANLLYILKSDRFKIGDRDIFFLKRDPGRGNAVNLLSGILNRTYNEYVSSQAKARLDDFIDQLNFYIQSSYRLRLKELVSLVYQHSGLKDHLRSGFGSYHRHKIKNVENLIKIASDFEDEVPDSDIRAFNTYLSQVAKTDYEGQESVDLSSEDSVKIMSIHAAKGLEFEVIFLPMLWANDYKGRNSNSQYLLPSSLRKDNKIWSKKEKFSSQQKFNDCLKEINNEEERRIFYVACSRAKKLLVLSHSQYQDQYDQEKNKSNKKIVPFFKEIARFDQLKVLDEPSLDFLKDQNWGQDYSIADSNWLNFLPPRKRPAPVVLNLETANKYLLDQANRAAKAGLKWMPENQLTKDQAQYQEVFSLTALLDYQTCPALYRYKYIWGLPEKISQSIEKGQKVHEWLEKLTRARYMWPEMELDLEKLKMDETIKSYLANYLGSPLFDLGGIENIWLEQLIYIKVGEFAVTAKLDRLDQLPGGKYRIIDYKAAEYKPKKIAENYQRQLAAYALACSDIGETDIGNIEGWLFFLENNYRHRIAFTSTDGSNIRNLLLKTITSINSGNFSVNKSGLCRYCQYKRFCQP